MSWLYTLKPRKDRLLSSLSRVLCSAGVTPNMVTAAGLGLSMLAGALLAAGYWYAGILVFLVGAGLDAVDGSLARTSGRCTEFGRYFDSACDRLSELAVIAGALFGGAPLSILAVMAGSVLLMASRVHSHRKGLRSDVAMFGRPERLALLVLGLLFPAPVDTPLFAAAGLLCAVSSVQILGQGKAKSAAMKPLEKGPLMNGGQLRSSAAIEDAVTAVARSRSQRRRT